MKNLKSHSLNFCRVREIEGRGHFQDEEVDRTDGGRDDGIASQRLTKGRFLRAGRWVYGGKFGKEAAAGGEGGGGGGPQ